MARIVLVEHEQTARADIASHLKEFGHEVIETRDGHQGVTAVEAFEPAFLISDVSAPYEDELVKHVAEKGPMDADMDVLLISAPGAKSALLAQLHNGADDFVTKPIDYDLLQAKMAAFERKRTNMIDRLRLDHIAVSMAESMCLMTLYELKSSIGIDIFKDAHLSDVLRR